MTAATVDPAVGVPVPKAALDLIQTAVTAGWSVAVNHKHDSGGDPFLTVQAARLAYDDLRHEVRATWHTRDHPGRLRLFDCLYAPPGRRWRDVSLKAATAAIVANPRPIVTAVPE